MRTIQEIAIELAKRRAAMKTAKDASLNAVVAAYAAHRHTTIDVNRPTPTDPCWSVMIPPRHAQDEGGPLPLSDWCAACRAASAARDAKSRASRMVGAALTSLDRAFAKAGA